MNAGHLILLAGAAYAWDKHQKAQKRRRASSKRPGHRSPPGTEPTPQPTPQAPATPPRLDITADCESWTMSDAWIVQVAQPRFGALLRDLIRARMTGTASDPDPVTLSYRILEDQHPGCPLPLARGQDSSVLRFDALQADVPGAPDYYPHAAILGLYAHITEAVIDALRRFEISSNPDELLFPL